MVLLLFFAQLLGKIGNFMAMSSLAAGVGGLFWLETYIQPSNISSALSLWFCYFFLHSSLGKLETSWQCLALQLGLVAFFGWRQISNCHEAFWRNSIWCHSLKINAKYILSSWKKNITQQQILYAQKTNKKRQKNIPSKHVEKWIENNKDEYFFKQSTTRY